MSMETNIFYRFLAVCDEEITENLS